MNDAPPTPPAADTAPAGLPHEAPRPEAVAALPAQLRYSASSLTLLDALARHHRLTEHAHDLPGQLSGEHPAWELLTHAAELHRQAVELVEAAVVAVRAHQTSWSLIATVLGGNRKSVSARYQTPAEEWEQRLAADPPTNAELDNTVHALTQWWDRHRAEPHTRGEEDAGMAALLDGLLQPPTRREQLDRIRDVLHAQRDAPLPPATQLALHQQRADLLAQQAQETGDPDDAERAADAAARAAHLRHRQGGNPTPTMTIPASNGPNETATDIDGAEEEQAAEPTPHLGVAPRPALADALATGSPRQVSLALSGVNDLAAELDAAGATRNRALAALALTAAATNLVRTAPTEISRQLYNLTNRISILAERGAPGLDDALDELTPMRADALKLPDTHTGHAFHAALTTYQGSLSE